MSKSTNRAHKAMAKGEFEVGAASEKDLLRDARMAMNSTVMEDETVKTRCAGTGCPSNTNCHRFTMPRNEEATPAALYVRREAGASACDLFLPVNPVTTFREDV